MSTTTTSPIVADKLRTVLLALLPRDGSPRTIKTLAHYTCMPASDVIDALLDDYMSGAVEFDIKTDSYRRSPLVRFGAITTITTTQPGASA